MVDYSQIARQTYYTFPWLNGSSEVLFEYLDFHNANKPDYSVLSMVKILLEEFPDLESRILQFFTHAAESKEDFPTPTDDVANLALYPILQILCSMLGNRVLGNALANIYAKQCQTELRLKAAKAHNSGDKYNDLQLRQICKNLDIECLLSPRNIINNMLYPFQMEFHSYLAIATKLTGEEWKLINRIFQKGKVHLIRDDIIMLLRETVRYKTKPDYKAIDKDLKEEMEKIPAISRIIAEVEKLIEANTQRFKSTSFIEGEKIEYELFPPCIKSILYRAAQGENLSHNERLAIAFFYLNTNHTIEETVDIFRTNPDFDESIARYQVEFAAGKGGKGKKYKMFKCAKLKTFRLCRADDPKFGDKLCVKGGKRRDGSYQPIQNPINDYLFWKKLELRHIHASEAQIHEDPSHNQTQKSTDVPDPETSSTTSSETPRNITKEDS